MDFRSGAMDDLDAIIGLFDENITWLVARGSEAQWGSALWSTDEKKIAFLRELLAGGDLTIAEIDGKVVGASLLSRQPMHYVPAIEEPERYLTLLIASPRFRGHSIGSGLIARAREQTLAEGIHLLRVDCWSGGDRKLVEYYTRQGFTPTQRIEVRTDTFVQVFEWRPGDS